MESVKVWAKDCLTKRKENKLSVVSYCAAGCKSCGSEWRRCCGGGAAESSSALCSNQPLPAGSNARSMFLSANKGTLCTNRALWAELLSRLNSTSEFHGLASFSQYSLLCQDIAPTHRFCSMPCASQCFAVFMTLVFQPTCGVKVTIYAPHVFKHPYWT